MSTISPELREALTAAGVPQLQQQMIHPVITEYQRRYSPLIASIPSGSWEGDEFYFNRRAVNPAGGFVRDGGARPLTASKYEQYKWQMKHLQSVGAVTGYAQIVTKQVVGDLRGKEIEGSIRGLYWDLETSVLWGNAGATEFGAYPQFSGLDTLLDQFGGTEQNAIDFQGGDLSLGTLDQMIDMVETNAAMPIDGAGWELILSNTAQSRIAQLLQNQQRFVGQVEVAAGLIVPTYRNVPMVKSSFLSTRNTTMSTTTAAVSAGGDLGVGAYRYRVSAIIARHGETQACASVTATTTSTNKTVALSFSPPVGLEQATPVLYKVYRSPVDGAAGSERLVGVVDAIVGVQGDNITPIAATSIVDDGVKLTPRNGVIEPADTPEVYVGGNTSKRPAEHGGESMFLIPRDDEFIYRPYVRELTPLDVYPTVTSPDSLPYAIAADTVLAIRAPKYIGGGFHVNVALQD